MLAKIPKTVYDGRVRRNLLISVLLLMLLFAFSTPKVFAKCSFDIQPTYTSDDVITITANQLTPGLIYFLWVDPGINPVESHNVTSTSSTFTAGKLAARVNPYGLSLTGKSSLNKLGVDDSCQGKTQSGSRLFEVNAPSGQTVNPNATLWILNGDTPPRCVQAKFGNGAYATQQECEEALARTLAALSTTPIPPNPLPCAKDKLINGRCTAVDTAIGEISTDPAKFVQRIFSLVLGVAGGIALLLIIISGYKFMGSQGNPEAKKAATEGLTSAIIGLLFIIFSFVILQIIGVDILRIPGFSK